MQRVGVLEDVRAHRVAALVERHDFLLFLAEDHRLALEPHEHAVACRFEVFAVHLLRPTPHGEQRRFVHEVREVGAAHARRPARQHVEVDVVV